MVSGNPRCCQRSLLGRSLEVVGCTLVAKLAINIRSAINMTYTPPNVQRLESLMFNGLESPLLFGIFRFHVQFRLMPWFPSLSASPEDMGRKSLQWEANGISDKCFSGKTVGIVGEAVSMIEDCGTEHGTS